MRNITRFVLIVALCVAPAGAQLVGIVRPNPAMGYEPITLTLIENRGGDALFLDGCIIDQVRALSPTGPIVWKATMCPDVLVPVPPYGTLSYTWAPPPEMFDSWAGQTYWLRVSYRAQGGPIERHFFAATWQDDPMSASLSGTPRASLGRTTNFRLSAPNCDFSTYAVAASMSTDTGVPMYGGYIHVALDVDSLFMASIAANPAFFTNFSGTLDAWGNSPLISLRVPRQPELINLGFYVQALVFEPVGPGLRVRAPELTNVLSYVVTL